VLTPLLPSPLLFLSLLRSLSVWGLV
jgi:hypothetical protein